MKSLTLFMFLLAFVMTVILLYPLGKRIDQRNKRLEKLIGGMNNDIDEELARPFSERFLMPIFYGMLKMVSRLFPKTNKSESSMVKLERDLKFAGIRLSARDFSAVRLIIVFACIGATFIPMFVGSIPPMGKLMIILFGTVLSILIPRYYLQSSIKKRQDGIRNQMPDVLDLLSVSVEAGLGFDAALLRVTDRSAGPLIEELVILHREMQMGKPRRDALKGLGERSIVGELKVFASSLIQADQLGISIRNVLKSQSQQLRLSRKQRAEEKAMKAPIKMMLPLVIFIFPVIFIILLGPSVIQVMNTFKG